MTSSRKGLLLQSDYFDKKSVQENVVFHVLPPGFITYRHMSDDSIFHFNRNSLGQSLLVSKEYPVFRAQSGLNANFLLSELNHSSAFAKFSGRQKKGGTRTRLYFGVLTTFSLSAPSRIEQDQISRFIETLDSLVVAHERKLDLLKKKKTYYLQQIFSQKLRFKGFAEPWQQRKLSELATCASEKNTTKKYSETLTNSAEYGVIAQRDFFYKDISNMANTDKYTIIRPDDFIYNPRVSKLAPFGPIRRNHLDRAGIVSPLYTVFRIHKSDVSFAEWYFLSGKWNRFMYEVGDTGARFDRVAISNATFMKLPVPVTSREEENLIGIFFETLDSLITVYEQKLSLLKKKKQSYLQKMFV